MNTNASTCITEQGLCEVSGSGSEITTNKDRSRETQIEKWLRGISNKLELSYLVNLK